MTIMVDERIGSADLAGHLRHWHMPCEVTKLDFGDAAFTGNGKDGPIYVGVEIKKVHDALNCMADGRFAGHKLPGLVSSYDRIWLLVEGNYRPDFNTGVLLAAGEKAKELSLGRRRFMFRDLDNWLTTMEVMGNIRVRRTGDRIETARVIADLYGWWNKDWSEHHSHLAMHEERSEVASLVRPTVTRKMYAQLPGVGWKKSKALEERFPSMVSLTEALISEIAEVEGIGKVMAERILNAVRQP